MRCIELIETAEVIDLKKARTKKFYQDLKKVADNIPNVFQRQRDLEQLAKYECDEIIRNSATNRFKYPSILAPYLKGINPVQAIYYESPGKLSHAEDFQNKNSLFALRIAYEHREEIIQALQADLVKFHHLKETIDRAVAHQYVDQIIHGYIHEWNDILEYFMKDLDDPKLKNYS